MKWVLWYIYTTGGLHAEHGDETTSVEDVCQHDRVFALTRRKERPQLFWTRVRSRWCTRWTCSTSTRSFLRGANSEHAPCSSYCGMAAMTTWIMATKVALRTSADTHPLPGIGKRYPELVVMFCDPDLFLVGIHGRVSSFVGILMSRHCEVSGSLINCA